MFRARRAQSGPAACSFPAGLREAPPLSFLYLSRRQQLPDSPPPLAPAALDLPPAAAPHPGPMRGTGSRFGPSLLFSIPHTPAAISLFLPCFSAPASLPSVTPGGKRRGGGCAWLGEPERDFVGKHPMPVPGALICRSVISQLSRRRERRIWCLSICEGAVCVCVSCIHVPMVIWRAPRCAEGGEPRRLLLLLSLFCAAFRLLPLLPEAEHRGLCVCLSVCLSCLFLAGRSGMRPVSAASRRRDWLRDGCHSPKVCSGSGQASSQGCRLAGPCLGPDLGCGPGAAVHTSGPGSCASHDSRVSFPLPPPFHDLGLETSNQARRCAEKLTSLSGEVILKGSPY